MTYDNTGFVTAYTDISGGSGDWAYAYYIKSSHGVLTKAAMIQEPMHNDTNLCEMYAIVQAVRAALSKWATTIRILVVTDSRNAQQILWHGSDKQRYIDIIGQFRQLEQQAKILIKLTKGHSTDDSDRTYLNNRCDKHSRHAVNKYRRSLHGNV